MKDPLTSVVSLLAVHVVTTAVGQAIADSKKGEMDKYQCEMQVSIDTDFCVSECGNTTAPNVACVCLVQDSICMRNCTAPDSTDPECTVCKSKRESCKGPETCDKYKESVLPSCASLAAATVVATHMMEEL